MAELKRLYGWILRMGHGTHQSDGAEYGFLLTLPGRPLFVSRSNMEGCGPFHTGMFVSYVLSNGQAVQVRQLDAPQADDLLATLERWTEVRSTLLQQNEDWLRWRPIFSRTLRQTPLQADEWVSAALRRLPAAMRWAHRLWTDVHGYDDALVPLTARLAQMDSDWSLVAQLAARPGQQPVPEDLLAWMRATGNMPRDFVRKHLPWVLAHAQELGMSDAGVRALSLQFLTGNLGVYDWDPGRPPDAVMAYLQRRSPDLWPAALAAATHVPNALVRLLFYAVLSNYEDAAQELRQLWEQVPALSFWPETHLLHTLLRWRTDKVMTSDDLFRQLGENLFQYFAQTGDLNQPVMAELFPECDQHFHGRLINPGGYCEATRGGEAWSTKANHWCRKKPCPKPHIYADLSKQWYFYNAFDWLDRLNIPYLTRLEAEQNPEQFPSKLAGWYNRINQKRPHLRCRQCGNVLLPNLRYARVPLQSIEAEKRQNVRWTDDNQGAAYQDTVFTCPSCGERVYLSHCLNADCHRVIDSRDQTEQCSNGRYVCTCGACCPEHSAGSKGRVTLKGGRLG
jgi:hypothetical protein